MFPALSSMTGPLSAMHVNLHDMTNPTTEISQVGVQLPCHSGK